MFKFTVNISGVDYTQYITYPLTLVEKNLDESENIYEVILSQTPFAVPIRPNQRAYITVEENNIVKRQLFLITVSDSVTKLGRKNLYDHSLVFMEFTHFLDEQTLPDLTITRVEGIHEPTLKDVAEKILFAANTDVSLSSETASILDNFPSPEWTFTRRTTLEALRLVFMIAEIIPYMNSFFVLGHVSIQGDRIDPEFFEDFGAFETAYNPETYKTSIKTNISNLVLEEGFEKIIEPENAWVTARSVDDFEIKEDDALIPTSRPINVVDNLFYRHDLEYSVNTPQATGGQAGPFIFKIDQVGLEYFKGLKDFVFEESRYNILPNISTITFDAQTDSFEVGKGSALFFTQGQPNIFGLGNRAPTQRNFLGINLGTKPATQAWPKITEFIEDATEFIYPEHPNLETRPILKRNRIQDLLPVLDNLIKVRYLQETGINLDTSLFTARRLGFTPFGPPEVSEPYQASGSVVSQFRIEYFPFVETNIKSFLPYNDIDSNKEVISQQYFNQQDNVVSINSLEELHQRVVNRGRGSTEILTYLDRTFDNIPELGTKINDFVLTSAQHTINRRNIISDYNFDEYFAKLNRFLAVLEEYRQFSIPNEKLVKRQFDTEIFAKFRTEPTNTGQLIIPEDYISDDPITAIQFLFNPEIDPQGGFVAVPQTLPIVITPFNNQVRIEVETLTNTKSGDRSVPVIKPNRTPPFIPQDDFEGTRRNEPVIYTDQNGFLDDMVVRFLKDYTNSLTVHLDWTLEDSFNLPITSDEDAILFNTLQEVQKDPREILRYTFAIHHVDDTQKGRITKKWSQSLGMVQGKGLNDSSTRLVFLNRKLESNEDTIIDADVLYFRSMGTLDSVVSGTPGPVEFTIQGNNILLPTANNVGLGNAQSWAIVRRFFQPSRNEIMYYYDEAVPNDSRNSQIYINFEDKWNTDLTFEVTFKDYDGTILKTEIVPYGGSATAPADPVNVPYIFTGWDKDFSVILGDLVVMAQFELPPIDVSPLVISVVGAASGAKTFTLKSGTASGGFTLDTTTVGTRNQIRSAPLTVNLNASTQGEITFLFIQRPASGTINLAASAGGTKNPDGDANTTISIVGTASGAKTFKFLDGDASTTIGVIGAAQGLQTAKFLEGTASTTINTSTSSDGEQAQVTATFNSAGGTPTFNSVTGTPPLAVSSPGTPTRTGYNFTGYSPSLPTTINTDTTFTAQWTPINFTISYTLNGGTNNPSNPSSYNIESATITLLNPTRSGFFFTGWTPTNTIPQGSTGNKTFTASWTAQNPLTAPTLQSGPTVTNTTTISFVLRHTNTNNVNLRGHLLLPDGGGGFFTYDTLTENNVPPNSDRTFTFENLPFSTQFFIGGQSLAITFPDVSSGVVNYNVSATTGAQPKTATPTTATSQATTNSVAFTITNNDVNSGTASWFIVEGNNTVASGSQFIGPSSNSNTRTITVEAFGLDPSTTYTLTNARVLADNKTISDPGTNRNLTTQALPFTATPSFESISSTETSVSFRIRNNEAAQVSARFSINANPDGSSPTVTISSSGLSTTFTFSGLASSTTFSVRADAIRTDGTKQRSNVGTQNITTQAPPPPPYDIRARLDSTQFASTSITSSLNSVSKSTTLNTSSFTTLYSVTGTNSLSISAPSSFTQSGTTFTFTRFVVNGVNQPLNQTTFSANVTAATDILIIYAPFA